MSDGLEMKCSNCYYYNGEKYDGFQFCDDREEDVYEDGYCCKWKRKDWLEV